MQDRFFLSYFGVIETSYNQPKLSPYTCWNSDPTTFANKVQLTSVRNGFFVDRNNTVYVTDFNNRRVHVWCQSTNNVTKTTFDTLFKPESLYVSSNRDIYVGSSDGLISKWVLNTMESVIVTKLSGGCSGLFIDINNYLYCSLTLRHRVMKQSLDASVNISINVAGTGINGKSSNALDSPRGIFVDINYDIYVADCNNHRIQVFKFGQSNGTTVAGIGGAFIISLSNPTDVFLDANNYLYIIDYNGNRIIKLSSNGFNCVVGCSGVFGTAPYQLSGPVAAAFDNLGNIFVLDYYKNKIQKFSRCTNDFGK